jgi:phytoene dehydrogenase-like protein
MEFVVKAADGQVARLQATMARVERDPIGAGQGALSALAEHHLLQQSAQATCARYRRVDERRAAQWQRLLNDAARKVEEARDLVLVRLRRRLQRESNSRVLQAIRHTLPQLGRFSADDLVAVVRRVVVHRLQPALAVYGRALRPSLRRRRKRRQLAQPRLRRPPPPPAAPYVLHLVESLTVGVHAPPSWSRPQASGMARSALI